MGLDRSVTFSQTLRHPVHVVGQVLYLPRTGDHGAIVEVTACAAGGHITKSAKGPGKPAGEQKGAHNPGNCRKRCGCDRIPNHDSYPILVGLKRECYMDPASD